MRIFAKSAVVALLLGAALAGRAESPNDDMLKAIPSPSIPAGPRPTTTVSPLESSPEPTATITPLPSASPSGTQPQTTNTVTPTPSLTP